MPPAPKPNHDHEELAPHDDRAITAGLKGSTVLLGAIIIIGIGAYLLLRNRTPTAKVQITLLEAPLSSTNKTAFSVPTAPFTDITAVAGISFTHVSGADGEKLLPETMGSGVAFLDFDDDGDPDLLLINGTSWSWSKQKDGSQSSRLYRNDTLPNGSIHFTDVTVGSGLDQPLHGMGAAVADYDNDGKPDILITAIGGAHLFHNDGGGHFHNVTIQSGVGGKSSDWSTAATWFDLDNDGDLDLFVANYVKWSREIDAEVGYKIDGTTRAYGPPMNFEGTFPYLYRNNGDGTFTDISATAGVQVKNPATGVPAAKTLGVAAVDFNNDSFMDLIVANDTVQNFVFQNRKDGRFEEVGALTGLAFDSYGNTRGAMGIDTARFTPDGRLGIAIGNFANEMTALYVAGTDPGLFTDESISWGIGPVSRLPLKFGVFFFDWDLDGRLDLLSSNGHLEEEITKVQASQKYRQSAQLFWNAGDAGFVPVQSAQAGSALFTPIVGRGGARADIDGDGDDDLILTQAGGAPMLLRNDQSLGHSWIRLKLVGSTCNRDSIGARIRVRSGSHQFNREITATRGYLSSSELPVTIGLGPNGSAESVEIIWPKGDKQEFKGIQTRRLTVLRQSP